VSIAVEESRPRHVKKGPPRSGPGETHIRGSEDDGPWIVPAYERAGGTGPPGAARAFLVSSRGRREAPPWPPWPGSTPGTGDPPADLVANRSVRTVTPHRGLRQAARGRRDRRRPSRWRLIHVPEVGRHRSRNTRSDPLGGNPSRAPPAGGAPSRRSTVRWIGKSRL
jgi:hypothetical protein